MRRSGNGDGGCGGDSISRRLLVFDTGTTFCSQEVEAVMADVVEVQEQSSIYVMYVVHSYFLTLLYVFLTLSSLVGFFRTR